MSVEPHPTPQATKPTTNHLPAIGQTLSENLIVCITLKLFIKYLFYQRSTSITSTSVWRLKLTQKIKISRIFLIFRFFTFFWFFQKSHQSLDLIFKNYLLTFSRFSTCQKRIIFINFKRNWNLTCTHKGICIQNKSWSKFCCP